jgi:2',3'-cyclic-nucleotide 2'-phosphodiesterase/3'-nucleotidase
MDANFALRELPRTFNSPITDNMSWPTRRDFLDTIAKAGFICAFPGLAGAADLLDRETVSVSILHTTDLHGHILPTASYDGTPDLGGLARCVSQIRRWRRKNPNTILIDAGDVYQGTDLGLRTRGSLMIDLFNHLKYDAWVVGNHEFDWGIDPFIDAVRRSSMPVLGANIALGDHRAGEFSADSSHPFVKIRPYLLKEVAGIRIAIIGITTPGMQYWFRREFIRDLNFLYPIEPVRRAMVQAKSEGANAIVIAGHMGLKSRGGGDDFANTVMSLTAEFPEVAVLIAGHTHQLISSRLVNNVLVTQADHFGIHIGRVDLVFDRNSKRLIARTARCERMDSRFRPDHVVLSRARSQLAQSQAALARPVGELAESFRARGHHDQPGDVAMLIGAAVSETLSERRVPVHGVFQGVFDDEHDLSAGAKTVDDIWQILPFENYVVTAQLTHDQLIAVMEEAYASHEERNLIGFEVATARIGGERRITSMTLQGSERSGGDEKYVIAFNTFDSRSAGHRFMKLRALLEKPEAYCTLHNVQTRDALIEYFQRHKVLRRIRPDDMCAVAA